MLQLCTRSSHGLIEWPDGTCPRSRKQPSNQEIKIGSTRPNYGRSRQQGAYLMAEWQLQWDFCLKLTFGLRPHCSLSASVRNYVDAILPLHDSRPCPPPSRRRPRLLHNPTCVWSHEGEGGREGPLTTDQRVHDGRFCPDLEQLCSEDDSRRRLADRYPSTPLGTEQGQHVLRTLRRQPTTHYQLLEAKWLGFRG